MSVGGNVSGSSAPTNSTPVLEALKRKQSGFDPRLVGTPYATGRGEPLAGFDAVPFPYQLRQPTQSTPLMEQIKKGMKPSETMEARGRKPIAGAAARKKKYEEEIQKMKSTPKTATINLG